MKIDSYQIGMDSARTSGSSITRKYTSRLSQGDSGASYSSLLNSFTSNESMYLSSGSQSYERSNDYAQSSSQSVMDAYESMSAQNITPISNVAPRRITSLSELHNEIVRYMWQALFGKKHPYAQHSSAGLNSIPSGENYSNLTELQSFPVITIEINRESTLTEFEQVSFSSNASVKTADGRALNFNLEFLMSREFTSYVNENSIGAANLIDPLTLNFSGDLNMLSDTKFFFDMDCDGTAEELSTLAEGNGFLALDRNNDGQINDGSELFGTKSGDGFKDLSSYDNDHNGWIDENDDIFDKLKVWVITENGTNELKSLKESNVGAIYLGSNDTDYTLRSHADGSINGVIRKSGVFLYEDGSGMGVVNQLDIAN